MPRVECESLMGPAQTIVQTESIELLQTRSRTRLWIMVRDGRRVVLKGLSVELMTHPEEIARLRKEYLIGVRLNHPNVCGVYGFETFPETGPVIVMEYVDGELLSEFFADAEALGGKATGEQRRSVATELAEALEYLHSMGVAHRDLKPDNVLVTKLGYRVKVVDFNQSDSGDSIHYKKGLATKEFGAPEQQVPCEGDCSVDVYAFGRILEMLLPERRYSKLRKMCQEANRARRPSMGEVVSMLKLRRHARGLTKWMAGAVAVVIAAASVLLWNSGDRNRVVEADMNQGYADTSTLTVEAGEKREAVAVDGGVVGHAYESARQKPESSAQRKDVDFDAIINRYLRESDSVVSRYGRLPYTFPSDPVVDSLRMARYHENEALADGLRAELESRGASESNVSQMLLTFWTHVQFETNDKDIDKSNQR